MPSSVIALCKGPSRCVANTWSAREQSASAHWTWEADDSELGAIKIAKVSFLPALFPNNLEKDQ